MDMASISEPSSCHNLYLFLVSWSCYSSLDTSLARTIYLAVIKSLFSDTCSCWSGNASNSAKTPCWQSLQTFITGNNIILRIFSIQYLWGKCLPIWRMNIFFYLEGLWSDVPFCVKKPRAWNMPAIQAWLQSVLATKDFIHLMFSSMLFTSQLHLKSKMHFFSCKFVTLISPFCCFMLLLIILYL